MLEKTLFLTNSYITSPVHRIQHIDCAKQAKLCQNRSAESKNHPLLFPLTDPVSDFFVIFHQTEHDFAKFRGSKIFGGFK